MVAVGVVDILPTCLSSVYFFYDPDYSYLSLGTYASLRYSLLIFKIYHIYQYYFLNREICFVRKLGLTDPNFIWYYLGFYIHSCPKMCYKGQYKPSFLLCPETYTFLPFSEAIIKLDGNKYSRLMEGTDESSENREFLSKVN